MAIDIQLRSIHKGDQKNVQKMFTEFNTSEFGKYDPIENTDDAHVLTFLENMVQNHVIYAISPTSSDEMIGYICFHIAGEEYDIGYMILAKYRGTGIATAASEMAMERVNEERGAKVFTATVAAENIPSVRVLEKLGFSLVSEKRVKIEENGTEYFITERRYEKRFSCDV
ncbi:MAG: GNAT family N-acetyltransferase [Lachnospiraceae bacterium]|nr:GNAT family N-acetyltransferase [Lachnospiraceae bacterium]